MVNNQEKVQEIQQRIQNYLLKGLRSGWFFTHQADFVERFHSENQEKNLEYTSFPPYCPTELQGLLQEWLIIQLETQFQARIQQAKRKEYENYDGSQPIFVNERNEVWDRESSRFLNLDVFLRRR
ncbi:10252_t:CDS:2, partial [Funneliformis geosporum]